MKASQLIDKIVEGKDVVDVLKEYNIYGGSDDIGDNVSDYIMNLAKPVQGVEGYTIPGWYYFDKKKDLLTGPFKSKEVATQKFVSDSGMQFTESEKIESWHKKFIDSYIEAMLWSTDDGSDESGGVPLEDNYSASDISDESMEKIKSDCIKFFKENEEDIGMNYERAGHDFWLNRNGHGTGFWDHEEIYGEEQAKRLDAASKKFGEVDPYVGDDGEIYL